MNVTAPYIFGELELKLTGTFLPGSPEQGPTYASGGQPAEPESIEDLDVVDIGIVRLVPAPPTERASHPRGVWQTTSILDGVDRTSEAYQRLVANIIALLDYEGAKQELIAALPEPDERDLYTEAKDRRMERASDDR